MKLHDTLFFVVAQNIYSVNKVQSGLNGSKYRENRIVEIILRIALNLLQNDDKVVANLLCMIKYVVSN